MDERFKFHRLYSSRVALLVCVAGMFGVFQYQLIFQGIIRWDLFWILLTTAIIKVGTLLWFRKHN